MVRRRPHLLRMSMISILKFVSDDEIRRVPADLDGQDTFVDELLDDEQRKGAELDKAWHGIHWLLTGSATDGAEPLCYLLAGGEPIADDGQGYGPMRLLSAHKVAEWNSALTGISRDELARRFDAKAMLKAQIYPEIWASNEEDTLGYLLRAYDRLRGLVATAAKEGSGLAVYLT